VPIARPEYGPSLAEVAGPRLRRLPPGVRWGGLAALVLVILLVVGVLVARGDSLEQTVVEGPLTFNTRYDDRIERVQAGPGELLRLETKPGPGRGPERLVFRDAGPAPTADEPAGGPVAQLALRMAGVIAPVREQYRDSFRVRSEGRVKIGRDYAGWLVRYQFVRDEKTWYGVRMLLLPDESGTTERVLDVSLESQRHVPTKAQPSGVIMQIADVGSNGPMRTPFYGLAFGTEKPGS
jgi:hypothetical protein